jgi:hypothetical protein
MALILTPNTGTFDVAVMFELDAGEGDKFGIDKNPVAPGVPGFDTPVEQDTPVVGLNPAVVVQPAGKLPTDTAQDAPVVVLNPTFDVQPAGKFPAGDADNLEFNNALVIGPT